VAHNRLAHPGVHNPLCSLPYHSVGAHIHLGLAGNPLYLYMACLYLSHPLRDQNTGDLKTDQMPDLGCAFQVAPGGALLLGFHIDP
jgi:hypothetical protein